ncbi:OmpP1/FadL family transporter [Oharaeibacter diazotrophicus]|uniref:Long-chain fatty acid transport protein n=1 Tax=Oharaeibacter diazotrophicus TaxID=1920512 RepID=A0A4R6RLZ9_9HYPH|nr:outer membrane protein transport protein [Oharaeibacter diazotrophicus]TDP87689.1 long-chain fatty acid transport protein [Oharaeibacter diazotrophicus]BBE74728.1 47 kDa outer membrane protein precursor [Pleomorphomonas sp. SM30]GLS77110.1 aromatic hydrocarbon degradation protein [Oharaeibacter diazotrophicus]
MSAKVLMSGIAAVAVAASTGSAFAGAFALREQSAYAQGSSFAGAAAPGDSISAMFWNPAAVTNAHGLTMESHHTFILPRSELSVDPTQTPYAGLLGNGGDVGIDAYVPSSYTAYQVNDSLYLGVSVNAPYGLSTHSEAPWVGQADHLRAKVFSANVTPTVGYKVNDQLSLGVGVSVQYFKVDLERAAAPLGSASVDLSGDDVGFGFTAGLTYKPFDGTEIGLGFRSSISHALDGDITVRGLTPTPLEFAIGADVELPETVTLGIRQKITDDFTLLGGVEWTNWSRLGTIPVKGAPTPTALTFEYKDGWFFSLGGEYAWNDQLTLRAGGAFELSPVEDEHRSMRLPDNDRFWASIGATYKVSENLSLDASYSHLFVEDGKIDVNTSLGTNYYGGTAESDIDIFAVSLRYSFGS